MEMAIEPTSKMAALVEALNTLRTSLGPILSHTYTTSPETSVQKGLQLIHGLFNVVGSVVFTILYIWSTYDQPAFGSWRYVLDTGLCGLFAVDYCVSLALTEQRLQYALKLPRLLDLLSFLPVLLEALLHSLAMASSAPLQLLKILRVARVLRIAVLVVQLQQLSDIEAVSATTVRMVGLVLSVLVLTVSAASVVQVAELIPFHSAFYFVTTTLTTVGFGDISPQSIVGRITVMAMIAIGAVTIPVQTAQLASLMSNAKLTLGSLPNRHTRHALVCLRLSDMGTFSELYSAIFHEANRVLKDGNFKLVCLSNRPGFDFQAFQASHDRSLSIVQGSATSDDDLVAAKAGWARSHLILADSLTADPATEDLSILLQVWAIKGFCKNIPLYVQVHETDMLARVRPFLEPETDTCVSIQDQRFRMLALAALVPGASTLLGNLMRSTVPRVPRQERRKRRKSTLGNRQWIRHYADSCAIELRTIIVPASLQGVPFNLAAEWLFRTSNHTLIGIRDGPSAIQLNPARRLLQSGDTVIVLCENQALAQRAIERPYAPVAETTTTLVPTPSREAPKPAPRTPEGKLMSNRGVTDGAMAAAPNTGFFRPKSNLRAKAVEKNGTTAERPGQRFVRNDDVMRKNGAELGLGLAASAAASREATFDDLEGYYGEASTTIRGNIEGMTNHIVVSGSSGNDTAFLKFIMMLRRCEVTPSPVVILHPTKPSPEVWKSLQSIRDVHWVQGKPQDRLSQKAARTEAARSLVYLRPGAVRIKSDDGGKGSISDGGERRSEEAIADADALLTLFGAFRDNAKDDNVVAELCFASSLKFLQPNLMVMDSSEKPVFQPTFDEEGSTPWEHITNLLQLGTGQRNMSMHEGQRDSWKARRERQRILARHGITDWQSNVYYIAGRVLVSTLMETYGATQWMFNDGLMHEVTSELIGDGPQFGGTNLRQISVPDAFVGYRYRQLFRYLVLKRKVVPLGLFRCKPSAGYDLTAKRLKYVHTNPDTDGFETILENTDRVFVVRERNGAWMDNYT